MPVEACPNCGSALPTDAPYCPNCGQSRAPREENSNIGILVLVAVTGIVAAFPVWFALGLAGNLILGRVGVPAGPQPEFYISTGTTVFFIFLTVLALVGLIVVARRRMSLPARVFALTFFAVSLGLFSICDMLGLSSRT